MNEDKKILSEILENTEKVKKVILEDLEKKEIEEKAKIEKKQKLQTSQLKAIAKFKRVGTQLNEEEKKRFDKILEENDTNANAYIKKLIFGGVESVVEGIVEDKSLEEVEKLKEENQKLKKENEFLKKEISEIEELGFWDIVKLWLEAKRENRKNQKKKI